VLRTQLEGGDRLQTPAVSTCVTTIRHDGSSCFSGRRVIKIYGRSSSEERRAALALRDIHSDRSPAALPPTSPAVRQLVATVCR